MKASEIRQKTGLTEKAMRLYEDKGLVHPEIRETGNRRYREYSEDDLAVLMTVAALRRARFSVEQIGRMLDDPHATAAVFHEYKEDLRREVAELNELLETVSAVEESSLRTAGELAEALTPVAEPMSLPERDITYRPYHWEDISEEERREAFERFWKKQEKRLDREYFLIELARLFGRVALCILLPSFVIAFFLYNTPYRKDVNVVLPAVEYNVETGETVASREVTMRGEMKYFLFKDDVYEGTLSIDGFYPYNDLWYDLHYDPVGARHHENEDFRVRLFLRDEHVYIQHENKKGWWHLYRQPLAKSGLNWTEYIMDLYFADPDDPLSGIVFYIMVPTSSSGASSGNVKLITPASDTAEAAAIWQKLLDRWAEMYGN